MIVKHSVKDYFRILSELLENVKATGENGTPLSLDESVEKAVGMIKKVRLNSKKVMIIGNGGSAAIASHAQNDLSNSAGVRAVVFHETPLLTALSNDHGYATVFERSIELWANPGDLLVAISSGGKSENILRGVESSLALACHIITFSGFLEDNPLRQKGHLNFYVPSQEYGYVEIAHGALVHFLIDCCAERKGSSR